MGWFMPEMEDTTIGEGLGIAQAFEVARRYLHDSCSSASENVVRSVNISIISDAYTVIDMIDGGVPPRKRIHANIWSLIRQKSHELRLVSGYNVTVELRWVPGHFDILGNDHADHTAVRARELQRDVFAVDLVEKELGAGDPRMPLGLHLQLENDVTTSSQERSRPRSRMLRLPRTPWEPRTRASCFVEPGRRLTLMPADHLLIAIQLEEDFQQCQNYRHQEIVDTDFIDRQLKEDFQQWEAHRHQENVNMEFICLQLQEEDQRWSPVYEGQELALRELPRFCPTMDMDESFE